MQTHSVQVHNTTKPTWLNVTLLKEDLNVWSQVNDFSLEQNIAKLEDYNSKESFLQNLEDLEKSLSRVGELVMKPSNLYNKDDSIIQFKVTDNVSEIINTL